MTTLPLTGEDHSVAAPERAIGRGCPPVGLDSVEPYDGDAAAWARFVEDSPSLNLMQTWDYGSAKASGRWSVERVAIRRGRRLVAVAQATVLPLPLLRTGVVWLNRGPILTRDEAPEELLPAVLAALRRYWVAQRGMYLRVAPPVERGSAAAAILPGDGYALAQEDGWASSRLDLSPGLDALRVGLAQKWRNCLNKAERLGVEVTVDRDGAGLERFLAEQSRLQRTKKSPGPDVLRALRATLTLLTVRRDGATVAGALIARYGAIGEYLAAFTAPAGRELNCGQALMWAAIRELKAAGAESLDLGGMDALDRASGPSHFKAGVRGRQYYLAPEIDAAPGATRLRILRASVASFR